MVNRVLYREDLPDPQLAGPGDAQGVQNYLLALFSKLENSESRERWILPSIADVSETLQVPKDIVWEGFRQVRHLSPWDIDLKTGYYGELTINPR